MKRAPWIAVTLVLLWALAACGGGGDDAPAGTPGCNWDSSQWDACNWQ